MAKTEVWRGRFIPATICCDALADAFNRGTDSEAYGSLAGEHFKRNGTWVFLSNVATPKFCPWCGKPNVEGVLIVEDEKETT